MQILFILISVIPSIMSQFNVFTFEVCKIKQQECFIKAQSEYEKWDCFGKYIFRKCEVIENCAFVKHDCGGVGWGNSIRALYNGFGLAALLDRRMIIKFKSMEALWQPPYELGSWDYGVKDSGPLYGEGQIESTFNFERYGREDDIPRFELWIKNLTIPKSHARYETTQILSAGVCAGVPSMILKGECTTDVLSNFGKCTSNLRNADRYNRVSEEQLLVPFFSMVFSKPSTLLVSTLSIIRKRLSLPELPPKYEPTPGLYGLYTPGYYILAFHFRRVPLGFEPLSVQLNDEKNLPRKISMLKAYWHHAKQIAQQAQDIAACRNESLLIYFATDDVHNLRPEAIRILSPFGRVVFGLTEDEVGHVSPMWMDRDREAIKSLASELKLKGVTKADMIGKKKVNSLDDNTSGDKVDTNDGASADENELINKYESSPEAIAKHGSLALTEWWILVRVRDALRLTVMSIGDNLFGNETGNSNWLVSHSGTSFSDSSAGWGFGPHGHLERLDTIHGKNNVMTSFRKDWNVDGCPVIHAVDPVQAEKCPNKIVDSSTKSELRRR